MFFKCSSNDERIPEMNIDETKQIKIWAIRNHIKRAHLSQLLCILGQNFLPQLPRTAVAFLNIGKKPYEILKITNEDRTDKFIYFSIKSDLKR